MADNNSKFSLTAAMPEWLQSYQRSDASADLLAAVIVTIMLIPQSLAYALLAGLPAQAGLYASILPLAAYAIFGSSRVLAVGPVAVISLMTAAAVSNIAAQGTPEYWGAALVLALLSGLMLMAMGFLRLGWIANYLSHPVVSGFVTASGILIAMSQLKHILGLDVSGHNLVELGGGILSQLGDIHLQTLIIGLAALGMLVWCRGPLKSLLQRFNLPPMVLDMLVKAGPVAAVVLTTAAVALFQLHESGVRVVGAIPQGLPELTLPSFDLDLWQSLIPAALLISLIGFVESISVAQTLAAKRRQRIAPNRELLGLGSANFAAAFSGGFPVTGGFSRSVVSFEAGARSPLAGVVTAVGIALTAALLTPLFHLLPKATLAATIIVAVLTLVDLKALKRTWNYSRTDFIAMAATVLVVLLVGVEAGVMTGVIASILLFLWKTSRPHVAVVGQVPETEHFRNVLRHEVITHPTILSIRVDESLYFANARFLEDLIYDKVVQQPQVEHVVLMCPAINHIDASALESLEDLMHRLSDAGVKLHLSEVKGPVMDKLKRSPLLEHLSGQVFLSQFQALQALSPQDAEEEQTALPQAG